MMSDQEIIKGCIKSHSDAQAALYNRYAPVLRGICMRYTGNKDDAEDVLHDSLIKALMAMKQYKGNGSFEGWLKRIAMNTCISYINGKNKSGVSSVNRVVENEADDPEETEGNQGLIERFLNSGIEKSDLLQAVAGLPDGYRMVLNMYVIDGMPHHEIAAQLGISINTSKSQLSRARNLLKSRLLGMIQNNEFNVHVNEKCY
ncbi:MAG: sigma-70 family RNA polymerase sigma factor [Bacteroidales bacterium]|nr:sigma-70 family RNA polymerase sigma factor [Bacteroidales bacterium]HOY38672.1 sigma-70 family RNA polymerase sigma factor [Bacteroidales bacterium]HQP04041.1 sigma-70 family RNA polymerase sigma factor [Bacteroidales bacterium]